MLVLPVALLWFHERSAANQAAGMSAEGMHVRQALQTRRFWIIAATFLLFSTGISGFIANFIPMLTDTGLSPGVAASYAGFIGLAVMAGRLTAGVLLDRVSTPVLSTVVMLLPTAGFLLGAAEMAPPIVLAVLVGFAGGAEFDLVAYMTARYFGLKHYGRLYGLLFSPIIAGAAFGPMLFGFGFERYGTYLPVLAACGVAFALASFAQLALRGKERLH
jgi:MFS family permease